METYRYLAQTAQGEETAGVIEAGSFDEALQMLVDRGLHEIQVFLMQPGKPPPPEAEAPVSLSTDEAAELSQHLAQTSESGIPLAAGLRAASEETANGRVAAALIWIAGQVEQGRTLEETLTESERLLPAHVSGLILAAARTGSLGEALFELVELHQKTYALRREISRGYVYPLLVLGVASGLIIGVGYFVTGTMKRMMEEFELALPLMTRVLFWWRESGIWLLGGFLLFLLVLAFLYRLLAGPVRWRKLLATMPGFGALWHWTSVSEWSGLLSIMLRHRVPLPEALRWAGRGVRDAFVGRQSMRMADGVARGRLLSQMMYTTAPMPTSIIPLVEWGEKSDDLADSFRVGQEMFAKRARMRATMLQAVIPPLLFVGIGSVVMFLVVAQFAPMLDLISALS